MLETPTTITITSNSNNNSNSNSNSNNNSNSTSIITSNSNSNSTNTSNMPIPVSQYKPKNPQECNMAFDKNFNDIDYCDNLEDQVLQDDFIDNSTSTANLLPEIMMMREYNSEGSDRLDDDDNCGYSSDGEDAKIQNQQNVIQANNVIEKLNNKNIDDYMNDQQQYFTFHQQETFHDAKSQNSQKEDAIEDFKPQGITNLEPNPWNLNTNHQLNSAKEYNGNDDDDDDDDDDLLNSQISIDYSNQEKTQNYTKTQQEDQLFTQSEQQNQTQQQNQTHHQYQPDIIFADLQKNMNLRINQMQSFLLEQQNDRNQIISELMQVLENVRQANTVLRVENAAKREMIRNMMFSE